MAASWVGVASARRIAGRVDADAGFESADKKEVLPAHKTAAVRTTFEQCRIQFLNLPPYSPDFNPIENAFSKLKRLVRSAAERTLDGLWSALGRLIDRFRPTECRNYFRRCGYAATITRS
jgi:transposase